LTIDGGCIFEHFASFSRKPKPGRFQRFEFGERAPPPTFLSGTVPTRGSVEGFRRPSPDFT
jgi:hypothetical protein